VITLKYFFLTIRPLAEDLLSTIVFAVLYEVTGSLTFGISLGMAVGILQILLMRWRKKPVEAMQWASLALVLVLGSASLLTGNPHFAMLKPSVAFFAIGCVMLNPNWLQRYTPAIVHDNLSPRALTRWGHAWSAMMFLLSIGNLYTAVRLGRSAWVWYTTFVPLTAQFVLFLVQFTVIRNHIARKYLAQANTPAAPTG
jgi:intracellular septation protein A